MNKKKIFLWTLYDFANSVVVVSFFLYFSQWLVIENKVPDIWFNLIFVGSTILLLATAPVLGLVADQMRVRMPFLIIVTTLQFIFLLAASFLAIFNHITFLVVLLAALAFLLGNYFYQFSFSFYNPLLADIAPPKSQGLISGIGQSANWLGQIAGILLAFPFLTGAVLLFGHFGRAQTLLPTTVGFFLLVLPMLILFKDADSRQKITLSILEKYKNYFRSFINLCKSPGLGRYLLSFFLFNDALLTAQNNLPIYLQQVFNISDKTKSLLLLAILVTSAVGALVSGFVADKIGLKRSLIFILVAWLIIFPTLAALHNFTYFTMAAIVMGFVFGATWSVTRAVMVYLSPKDKLNYAFSYYTLSERFSTFLGPVVWGLITSVLFRSGNLRYRLAVVSITVFILIGLIIVKKIPSESNV